MKKIVSAIKNNSWIIISYIINGLWMAYFFITSGLNFMPSPEMFSTNSIEYHLHTPSLLYSIVKSIFYKQLTDFELVLVTSCIVTVISTLIAIFINKVILKKKTSIIAVIVSLTIQLVLSFLIVELLYPLIRRSY